MIFRGHLAKMKARAGEEVQYSLVLDGKETELNPLLGKELVLRFTGEIHCVACGKLTKKSWQQGHCFPCTQKLAECDMCILKPELCHYAAGTCREPKWGEEHCLKPHVVYLANTSGLKVGITRERQVPTRWLDQGATEALPIAKVASRLDSGKVEIILSELVADKTHWQKMLKGEAAPLDLKAEAARLVGEVRERIAPFVSEFLDGPVQRFNFPVRQYPEKVKSYNVEKTPEIRDTLVGIKGQYLIFSQGVLNVRNHAGHLIELETP